MDGPLLLLLPSALLLVVVGATFSFHVNAAINDPTAKKNGDTSKGPVGPRFDAAHPATCPAPMATKASMVYANPKRGPKQFPFPEFCASLDTHASGALFMTLAPTPPKARPTNKTHNNGDFVDKDPNVYKTAAKRDAFFRPYLSVKLPTVGPNKAMDANCVKNNLLIMDKVAGAPFTVFDAKTANKYGPDIQKAIRNNQKTGKYRN